ncbi:hypothetical protein F2Q69_00000555 [Brassica cretica]|uniref:Glycoside hydrolase family 38 central domain-containing protein n=1 Tax=Brassica cretica TaxID=69181 RepID=A0A8S9NXP6_BRACR|nr:hypothetical protein F2Q69_00000555 [Brassica cretica]
MRNLEAGKQREEEYTYTESERESQWPQRREWSERFVREEDKTEEDLGSCHHGPLIIEPRPCLVSIVSRSTLTCRIVIIGGFRLGLNSMAGRRKRAKSPEPKERRLSSRVQELRQKERDEKEQLARERVKFLSDQSSELCDDAKEDDNYEPPPGGFYYEITDDSPVVQDDPDLFDFNVQERVNAFVAAALDQANITRTNHIMFTMGTDFRYQYAHTWFRQMDKLLHYVNLDGRINALYSTPSIYTDAKHAANEAWPLKTEDYFPYADRINAYWTGYFTSRPALKRYVRVMSGYYLAARQLEFFKGRSEKGPNTDSLADALAIAQHHDAVSGTSKQHVANDYAKRLAIGYVEAESVVATSLAHLTKLDPATFQQDDPDLFDYNVQERVNAFVAAALDQANITRTNHIMFTMGTDFRYQYAHTWFRQMDKLLHYVNLDGRINALYSTPSIYTDAKHAANEAWPLKTEDYFPYADRINAYWTGYFTSRPALKRYVRVMSGYYLTARQLEFFKGRSEKGPNTDSLADAVAIAQHHDAVSGTSKQHVANDYAKRLAIGYVEAESVVATSLAHLTKLDPATFQQTVLAYNPLGWKRVDIVRLPVVDGDIAVHDSEGHEVESQLVPFTDEYAALRSYHVEAYLGHAPTQVPKHWLLFSVSVPPLGFTTYTISTAKKTGTMVQTYIYFV